MDRAMSENKSLRQLLAELTEELSYIRLTGVYEKLDSIDKSLKQIWKLQLDNMNKYIQLPPETYSEIKTLIKRSLLQMMLNKREEASIPLPEVRFDTTFDVLSQQEKLNIIKNAYENLLSKIYRELVEEFDKVREETKEEEQLQKKGHVNAEIKTVGENNNEGKNN